MSIYRNGRPVVGFGIGSPLPPQMRVWVVQYTGLPGRVACQIPVTPLLPAALAHEIYELFAQGAALGTGLVVGPSDEGPVAILREKANEGPVVLFILPDDHTPAGDYPQANR